MKEPDHSVKVARLMQPFGAMVVASPGTKHVTVVHADGKARRIDEALRTNHFLIERIDQTRVKVSPPSKQFASGHDFGWPS